MNNFLKSILYHKESKNEHKIDSIMQINVLLNIKYLSLFPNPIFLVTIPIMKLNVF